LNTAADYYYHPGWWEPGAALEVQINLNEWNALPAEYQEIIKVAAFEANTVMQARYEARNGAALTRLVQGGTQLRTYSDEILAAAQEATLELYEEFSAADADFKSIYEQWNAFRNEIYAWNKINEAPFTNFVYGQIS
jgi:TRAP-type mannitol/chloroaromatic compound transport system substrate-binding protein